MESNTLAVVLVVVLSFLFAGIGGLLIFLYRRNKKKATESLAWSETTGTVVKSVVRVEESVFGSDDSQGESQPMYSADISYTYQIGGMLHTSERISFSGKSSYSKREKAEEITAQYSEGSRPSVFYNPNNHHEAVLERSAKGSRIFLWAGMAFLAVALITIVVGFFVLI